MRTMLIGAVTGLVAMIGFAGTANASAVISLLWAGGGGDTISPAVSSSITLNVVLTPGPLGSAGAGVSVDYSDTIGKLTVTGFASCAFCFPLFNPLGTTTNNGSIILNINAAGSPGGPILAPGQSFTLGTITFHKPTDLPGTTTLVSGLFAGSDAVLNGVGTSANPSFNNAFVVNPVVPEPTTVSLLALGLGGLALAGRRKN